MLAMTLLLVFMVAGPVLLVVLIAMLWAYARRWNAWKGRL